MSCALVFAAQKKKNGHSDRSGGIPLLFLWILFFLFLFFRLTW